MRGFELTLVLDRRVQVSQLVVAKLGDNLPKESDRWVEFSRREVGLVRELAELASGGE